MVGLTVIELTPSMPFDHLTMPEQPDCVMVTDEPLQIELLGAEIVGATGFGLTVTVVLLLLLLTQPVVLSLHCRV